MEYKSYRGNKVAYQLPGDLKHEKWNFECVENHNFPLNLNCFAFQFGTRYDVIKRVKTTKTAKKPTLRGNISKKLLIFVRTVFSLERVAQGDSISLNKSICHFSLEELG